MGIEISINMLLFFRELQSVIYFLLNISYILYVWPSEKLIKQIWQIFDLLCVKHCCRYWGCSTLFKRILVQKGIKWKIWLCSLSPMVSIKFLDYSIKKFKNPYICITWKNYTVETFCTFSFCLNNPSWRFQWKLAFLN